MTDYEKAMLIMQQMQLEYLHIIAWDAALRRNSDTDRDRVRNAAKDCGMKMVQEVPAVVKFLGS